MNDSHYPRNINEISVEKKNHSNLCTQSEEVFVEFICVISFQFTPIDVHNNHPTIEPSDAMNVGSFLVDSSFDKSVNLVQCAAILIKYT